MQRTIIIYISLILIGVLLDRSCQALSKISRHERHFVIRRCRLNDEARLKEFGMQMFHLTKDYITDVVKTSLYYEMNPASVLEQSTKFIMDSSQQLRDQE